jgi:hypothetical protein
MPGINSRIPVKISITGVSNSHVPATRAESKSHTIAEAFERNDSTFHASLTPANERQTKAPTYMTNGNKYRVFAFDSSNGSLHKNGRRLAHSYAS